MSFHKTVNGIKGITLTLCICMAMALPPLRVSAEIPEPDDILATSAVLMDADTGQVLYEKNPREVRQPASITKILTAMLVLENLQADTVMTASAAAVNIPYWGSSAYIEAGERLTVEQAMYAMMLRSANEAANILAEEVAGSMSDFAELMNQRARELGAESTHFVNASGLPARNHVTTAYDMALITRQAIQTTGFLTYFSAPSYSMAATNRSGERIFTNTHRMLLSSYDVYNEEAIGGKTGYTTPSGYTLATVAQRDGRTLICIILDSESYYADTNALLEFGFTEFTPHTYTFADTDPMEASIWEGDWEAGRVFFSRPEQTTILLHHSVTMADVSVDYDYPQRIEDGQETTANAVLHLSGGGVGLPETLLAVPLPAEVTTYDPPPAETPEPYQPPAEPSRLERFLAGFQILQAVVILITASAMVCIMMVVRQAVAQRRRRQRRRSYRLHSRGQSYME